MPALILYGLRCYQLQKQLGLFTAQGRVIPWIDGRRVRLLSSR